MRLLDSTIQPMLTFCLVMLTHSYANPDHGWCHKHDLLVWPLHVTFLVCTFDIFFSRTTLALHLLTDKESIPMIVMVISLPLTLKGLSECSCTTPNKCLTISRCVPFHWTQLLWCIGAPHRALLKWHDWCVMAWLASSKATLKCQSYNKVSSCWHPLRSC